MTMTCSGLAKLLEECGELVQVAGKKLACYSDNQHWDGSDLGQRLEDEMGDVKAAIDFVIEKLNLNRDEVSQRHFQKLRLFKKWDKDPTNNAKGVDA